MWPMSLEPSPLWTRSMQWGCTGLEAEGLAIGMESWQKWTSFLERLVCILCTFCNLHLNLIVLTRPRIKWPNRKQVRHVCSPGHFWGESCFSVSGGTAQNPSNCSNSPTH